LAEAVGFAEKRVTWAELFFDLVFVFAVTQVSGLLRVDHSVAGLGRAAVLFVPVYWSWVGTTVHANTRDVDNAVGRLGIFAVGLGGLFLALAVPGAYGGRGVLFGASYLALRITLALLSFWGRRVVLGPLSVAVFLTGPLLLVGGLLPGGWRELVWAVAAVLDLATPVVARRRLMSVPFHPTHLPERFGLFVLIALGESIVGMGVAAAAAPHLRGAVVVALALSFVLACGLWWVYYVFAASAIEHAMRTATVLRVDLVRQVLSYGHLAFIGGIIAVAVGMSDAVAAPGERLARGVVALLFGGCALYLGTFGYTRWHMFARMSWTRLAGAVVVLAVVPVALVVPGVVALGVLAGVVVGLNAVEHVLVRRAGGLPG
jgi:low temperature requirement protein LtrA